MSDSKRNTGRELERLAGSSGARSPWRKWGPYLSERQWGTVREDYSASGDAWSYFPHDHARSRAYRWGEDGIAGISDDEQQLCFAVALWNGKDPILKERMFGLTNSEGNHGEDVKEYYFYLDSTPTHSYMKYLYKYPHSAFPYEEIVKTNATRSRLDFEYELLDTGVFSDSRYFDVFVEYAKASPEDILIRITVANRGAEPAALHVLPTLWFRNTWSWGADAKGARPVLRLLEDGRTVAASHPGLGERFLHADGAPDLLFTENETNAERIHHQPNRTPYVKDAFDTYLVHDRPEAVNPAKTGTKMAAHYAFTVGAGATEVLRLRLSDAASPGRDAAEFDAVMDGRQKEADEFYAGVIPPSLDADAANVMRQALAGMLWSKQFYNYDVDRWLSDRGADPFKARRAAAPRNDRWHHMQNADIISMPDKWEYPWYAAWDLAFHVLPLTLVDPDFGKQQLDLMLQGRYLHPSGQIPAYEWNFGDVNPPVHAWATIFTYRLEKTRTGKGDLAWLERSFHKLLLNFTWWVNRKDRTGNNVFEGGFLGLDNIGVFDRSAPLPTGGYLEQADGTAWMALFSQNMMELALELTAHDSAYEDMVSKFVEHFAYIATSMNQAGEYGMWDEEDGFYYDLLRLPDGSSTRLKVRSMVGLLPLCATTVVEKWQRDRVPEATARMWDRLGRLPEILESMHVTGPGNYGVAERGIVALVNEERLRRILTKMLDENEFLSPYGIRSLSKFHEQHPYTMNVQGQEFRVDYLPAESNTGMFGGNSNWRGPVWMPVNIMIIRALQNYYLYYGDNFKIECPTGSGKMMNLFEVSKEIADRLSRIFLRDEQGKRPVYGGTEKFQSDPYWRDQVLFYEYFHGDNGAGLGASHQTGWTGLVAKTIQLYGVLDPKRVLEGGKLTAFRKGA